MSLASSDGLEIYFTRRLPRGRFEEISRRGTSVFWRAFREGGPTGLRKAGQYIFNEPYLPLLEAALRATNFRSLAFRRIGAIRLKSGASQQVEACANCISFRWRFSDGIFSEPLFIEGEELDALKKATADARAIIDSQKKIAS